MLPHIVSQLLVGLAPDEQRRRQRPLPIWQVRPGARHPAEGEFVIEEEPSASAPAPILAVVDPAVAQQLAEEARRLSVQPALMSPPTTPDRQTKNPTR